MRLRMFTSTGGEMPYWRNFRLSLAPGGWTRGDLRKHGGELVNHKYWYIFFENDHDATMFLLRFL